MALLPPTVGERLAKCGTTVVVWGVVPGANVELRIDGATQNRVVNDSWTEFTVASLNANQQVTARQTLAPDPTSADSPAVVVGDVQLPPPSPRLAPTISAAPAVSTPTAWCPAARSPCCRPTSTTRSPSAPPSPTGTAPPA